MSSNFLKHQGQRICAERMRRGQHLKPYAVAAAPAPRPRGMEDVRGWDHDEDGA